MNLLLGNLKYNGFDTQAATKITGDHVDFQTMPMVSTKYLSIELALNHG